MKTPITSHGVLTFIADPKPARNAVFSRHLRAVRVGGFRNQTGIAQGGGDLFADIRRLNESILSRTAVISSWTSFLNSIR